MWSRYLYCPSAKGKLLPSTDLLPAGASSRSRKGQRGVRRRATEMHLNPSHPSLSVQKNDQNLGTLERRSNRRKALLAPLGPAERPAMEQTTCAGKGGIAWGWVECLALGNVVAGRKLCQVALSFAGELEDHEDSERAFRPVVLAFPDRSSFSRRCLHHPVSGCQVVPKRSRTRSDRSPGTARAKGPPPPPQTRTRTTTTPPLPPAALPTRMRNPTSPLPLPEREKRLERGAS